jgi:hypothetical protein
MVNEQNLTPKTETVYELKQSDYEIKTSKLSPAARSKIIKMSGGNYVSERGGEGYGPTTVQIARVHYSLHLRIECYS